MGTWLWVLIIAFLSVLIAALIIKIVSLKRAVKDIEESLSEKLTTDTNTLIDISSNDKRIRSLAGTLNRELAVLRKEKLCYMNGNNELKNSVTNISHDLRTPLTAICGYIELLEREEKTKEAEKYLDIIKKRVEFMVKLTEELFGYSVIMSEDGGKTTSYTDVKNILEESIASFYEVLISRNIVPVINLTKEKVIRKTDSHALSRVFSNLLNNAVKYSDGDLEISLFENGEIVFANTASKLDAVEVEKLFDRFYTVETAKNSTGLGLSIAKTLVEQMRGEISAKYKDGKLYIKIILHE